MDLEALTAFLQDRLVSFDPSIDVAEGGSADREIVQPILRLLGNTLVNDQAYRFVLERLRQYNQNDVTDEADALTDLAIKPLGFILEPLGHELSRLSLQTLRFPELLSRESAQNIASNLFLELSNGTYTTGTARLLFTAPIGVVVNGTNVLSTLNGDRFIPSSPQGITQSDMALNRFGSFYYFDVFVRAMTPGAIQVGRQEMYRIEGVNSVVRVTNLRPFETGKNRESIQEFVERAKLSLTERSLTTSRGASARLFDVLAELRAVEVVGHNDPEMGRDRVDYSSSGDRARQVSANTIVFPRSVIGSIVVGVDDGAGGSVGPFTLLVSGGYSNVVDLAARINQEWRAAGGGGCIAASQGENALMLQSPSEAVYLESRLTLLHPPVNSAWAQLGFAAEQIGRTTSGTSGLILSTMPGGLLRPNLIAGVVDPGERSYHLGGCTDIYVRPSTSDVEVLEITSFEDGEPVWLGTELATNTVVSPSDRVQDQAVRQRAGNPDFSSPLSPLGLDFQDDFRRGVQLRPGDTLFIRQDADVSGVYKICATPAEDTSLAANELRVNQQISFDKVDLTFHLSTGPRARLTAPQTRTRIHSLLGTQLRTFGGSRTAQWAPSAISEVDSTFFDRYGVSPGDILRIYQRIDGVPSANREEYTILGVTGDRIEVSAPFVASESVTFSIYALNSNRLSLPLIHIQEVRARSSVGDSIVVPYALPTLIQSRGLSGAQVVMDGLDGELSFALPDRLFLPSTPITKAYRKFTDFNLRVGMVVRVSHVEWETPAYRTVLSIDPGGYEVVLSETLPPFLGDPTGVSFSIGYPARGSLRVYFQDPTSFEICHSTYRDALGDWSVGRPLLLARLDDAQQLTLQYSPESLSPVSMMRRFPETGVSAGMTTNFSVPTFATVDFSTFAARELLLLPRTVGEVRDFVHIYPERYLGQRGGLGAGTDPQRDLNAYIRKAWRSTARVEVGGTRVVVQEDFFDTLSYGFVQDPLVSPDTVDNLFGTLRENRLVFFPAPDGSPSPNEGEHRIIDTPNLKFVNNTILMDSSVVLTPTDQVSTGTGSQFSDQTEVTITAGNAINFVQGERVRIQTSPVIEATACYVSGAVLHLCNPTEPALLQSLLSPGTVLQGVSSGAQWQVNTIQTVRYACPEDGTNRIRFAIAGGPVTSVAPGIVPGTTNGPWAVGRYIALYGVHGRLASISSKTEVDWALHNAGVWKITTIALDGLSVTVESVANPLKTFENPADTILMSWVVSAGERPLETFAIYEENPKAFPITNVLYEDAGISQSARLQIQEPTAGILKDDTQGRLYHGYDIAFDIRRAGRSRVSSTDMSGVEQDGLFYFDLPVISSGPESEFDAAEGEYFFIASDPDPIRGAWVGKEWEYEGEGYVLEVQDDNLTFSVFEEVDLVCNPSLLPRGAGDAETSRILLEGRLLEITYAWSSLVATIDQFVRSDSERVTCASMMAKHFAPALARLALSFSGTATEEDLTKKLEDYINAQQASTRLEVSDLEGILSRSGGVDFLEQTYQLVVLFHDVRRRVWGERSPNFVGGGGVTSGLRRSTDRMSYFIADRIAINRS